MARPPARYESVVVNIRMPREQERAIKDRADTLGIDRSEWMRLVLAAALRNGEPEDVKAYARAQSFTPVDNQTSG